MTAPLSLLLLALFLCALGFWPCLKMATRHMRRSRVAFVLVRPKFYVWAHLTLALALASIVCTLAGVWLLLRNPS